MIVPVLNQSIIRNWLLTSIYTHVKTSAVSDTNRETSDVCPEGRLFSNSTVYSEGRGNIDSASRTKTVEAVLDFVEASQRLQSRAP